MKRPPDFFNTSNRFGRESRILKTSDFLRIKQLGQRKALGCLVANWISGAPSETTRLGVITSRKIGNAVHRNRARRLMREAFRVLRPKLARPIQLVLVARPSIRNRGLAKVVQDLERILQQTGFLSSAGKEEPGSS